MKTQKLIQTLLLFLIILIWNNCVQNNEFELPSNVDIAFKPNPNDVIFDISAVIGEFVQQGKTFTYDEPLASGGTRYISGYVVSNDKSGNFFEELVIQDRAENPTSGVVIQIDVSPLYTFYEFGRKVFIKLDGLSVGEVNGIIQVGVRSGDDIEKIPGALRNDHIIRDVEVATIVPLEVSISDFTPDKENLFIRLTDVQFTRDEVIGNRPLTFAAEVTDQFNGERMLESCKDQSSVILSTSTFSDFKSLPLPINRGNIDGVLARNFFDDYYTLVLNSPQDINFSNNERCDPIILDCGLATTEGPNILFEDDFENQSSGTLVSGNGWTNYIEAGSEGWEAYTSNGSNASLGISVRISAFGSDNENNIGWLITPAIDISNNSGITLSFQTSNSFSDSSKLDLLFSNDWDGTELGITSATWGLVPQAYIVQNSDFFGSWLDSGIVDISCATGNNVYFAFRYRGNDIDDDFNGTYELDNIRITAN